MSVIYTQYYHSPCGDLILGSYGDRLCLCDWVEGRRRDRTEYRVCSGLRAVYKESTSPVIEAAIEQLDAYFSCERTLFTIPLLLVGSDFQQSVWRQLQEIPYGLTVSYGELAHRIGRPLAVRAVANANGANALSIFAPCHRVIGSDHSLTGYGGGLATKQYLLQLEANPLPL